ncbi:helix-turn-helix transcriptional regulator [Microbacteriaceae bacterium VKM Ac-2854]|nr:helix-turn-helix transcriptional regulator [Microbacteriaceae bacterium VKM Ac-2854]
MFGALADRTRRAILVLLRERDRMTVGEVTAAFPYLSRPAVSAKLAQLRRAGLVTELREGSYRRYSLADPGPGELLGFLHRVWGDVAADAPDESSDS